MLCFTRVLARRPPALLLLWLLALLLWGQCGNSTSSGPNYDVRVVRTDGLRAPFAGAPPRLYLTLGLRNHDPDDFRVESLDGVLLFRGLYWNYIDDPQRQEILVPGRTEVLVPLVLRLIDSLACAPDSLRLLRQALRGGTARDSTLYLRFRQSIHLDSQSSLSYPSQDYPLPPLHFTGPPK